MQERLNQSGSDAESEARVVELRAFLGPAEAREVEVVDHWRNASPAAHAQAMIELSRYAEDMAAQTGLGKDPDEQFPGFPEPPLRQRVA